MPASKHRHLVSSCSEAFDDVAEKGFGAADMRNVVVEDEEDFHAAEYIEKGRFDKPLRLFRSGRIEKEYAEVGDRHHEDEKRAVDGRLIQKEREVVGERKDREHGEQHRGKRRRHRKVLRLRPFPPGHGDDERQRVPKDVEASPLGEIRPIQVERFGMESVRGHRGMRIERQVVNRAENHVGQDERERNRQKRERLPRKLGEFVSLMGEEPKRPETYCQTRNDHDHALVLGEDDRVGQDSHEHEAHGVFGNREFSQIDQSQQEVRRDDEVEIRPSDVPGNQRERTERIDGHDAPERRREGSVDERKHGQPEKDGDGIHERLVPSSGHFREIGFVQDELERVFGMSASSDVREALRIVGDDFSRIVDLFRLGVPVSLLVVEIRGNVVGVESREEKPERDQKQERNDQEGLFSSRERKLGNVRFKILLARHVRYRSDRRREEDVLDPEESRARPTGKEEDEPHHGDAEKVPVSEELGRGEFALAVDRAHGDGADGQRREVSENESEERHKLFGFLQNNRTAFDGAYGGDVFVYENAAVVELAVFVFASRESGVKRLVLGVPRNLPGNQVVRNVMPERPFGRCVEIDTAFLSGQAVAGGVDESVEVAEIEIGPKLGIVGRKEGFFGLDHGEILVAHQEEVVSDPKNQNRYQSVLRASDDEKSESYGDDEKTERRNERGRAPLVSIQEIDGGRFLGFRREKRSDSIAQSHRRRHDVGKRRGRRCDHQSEILVSRGIVFVGKFERSGRNRHRNLFGLRCGIFDFGKENRDAVLDALGSDEGDLVEFRRRRELEGDDEASGFRGHGRSAFGSEIPFLRKDRGGRKRNGPLDCLRRRLGRFGFGMGERRQDRENRRYGERKEFRHARSVRLSNSSISRGWRWLPIRQSNGSFFLR